MSESAGYAFCSQRVPKKVTQPSTVVDRFAPVREVDTEQTNTSPPKASNWRLVGSLTDGPKTLFVEVAQTAVRKHEVYDDAVKSLCPGAGLCRVMFFAPGDRTPASQSLTSFISSGGFTGYRSLAVWVGNRNNGSGNFTAWDCDRGGVDGAPMGALCGTGVAEAYSAILNLASRAGMQTACGW